MYLEKTVTVGDQTIRMRASALIPRLYRIKFGRDVIVDLRRLQGDVANVRNDTTGTAALDVLDLTIFEDITWLMAKHADPSVPSDPNEWLDMMPAVFSVYEVLPEVEELLMLNSKTTAIPAKK